LISWTRANIIIYLQMVKIKTECVQLLKRSDIKTHSICDFSQDIFWNRFPQPLEQFVKTCSH
jgi:hypothetical protein